MFYTENIIDDFFCIEEIEGLILLGGYYKKHNTLIYDLIKKLNKNDKIIGAICGAAIILAETNIIKKRIYYKFR